MYKFIFNYGGITNRIKGAYLAVSETGSILVTDENHDVVAVIPQGVYVVAEEAKVE